MSAALKSMNVFGPINGDICPIDVRLWLRPVTGRFQSLGNRITFVMCELDSEAPVERSAASTRFGSMGATYSQWMWVNEQQAMGNKKPSQNWDDLRYFLALLGRGRSRRQPSNSAQTHDGGPPHQALEDELNSRLFHKSNSGYRLTDVGERLLAGAEAIESAYVSAKAAASWVCASAISGISGVGKKPSSAGARTAWASAGRPVD
jgi:hypothetical protein